MPLTVEEVCRGRGRAKISKSTSTSVDPAELVAVMEKAESASAEVGVPEMTPEVAFNVSPAGRDEGEIEYVVGVPPATVGVRSAATPCTKVTVLEP